MEVVRKKVAEVRSPEDCAEIAREALRMMWGGEADEGVEGRWGMIRRVFVNTAWNSKPHVCYEPDKDEFFETNDLRELVGRYDEVYVDSSLFPNMWTQLRPLIENDVWVFLLLSAMEVERIA